MNAFGRAYKQLMFEGRVTSNKISLAIDKHKLVVIRYNTHGERVAMADRLCGVFAYGVTKAGNDCIRVFEYKGDTTTFIPGWKLIRIDRIISWHETKKTFDSPPIDTGVGEFNPNGDESMSLVYKIAKFGDTKFTVPTENKPKTSDSPQSTISHQQQKKQLANIQKTKDGLKPYQGTDTVSTNEPKLAPTDTNTQQNDKRYGLDGRYKDKPIKKTDTELAIDYLRRQLNNPEKIDLSKFNKEQQQNTQTNNNGQITNNNDVNKHKDNPLKKTDTKNAMEYLRKQLKNPEKTDLEKT